ncbi:MAG: hypothetical protein R3B99_15560 [Polyangiales bacterium]
MGEVLEQARAPDDAALGVEHLGQVAVVEAAVFDHGAGDELLDVEEGQTVQRGEQVADVVTAGVSTRIGSCLPIS